MAGLPEHGSTLDPIFRIASFHEESNTPTPGPFEEDLMLPPFIIEQIRRREEEERKQYEQPQLELPISPSGPPQPPKRREESEEGQRGVVILEL